MRKDRKYKDTYFFSVEGETEVWYFEWLQRIINSSPTARYTVRFHCKKQKDPLKYAKGFNILRETEVVHVVDVESEDEVHVKQFTTTLGRMEKAEKLGKDIKYRLGYSNFTFDLWIILHKMECNGAFTHRSQYVSPINRAYSEKFENLDQYKHEDNFKRVLSKLTLDDVCQAIRRSKYIMQRNKENGYVLHQHKGYEYYKENPSLSIGEVVEKIMSKCDLL